MIVRLAALVFTAGICGLIAARPHQPPPINLKSEAVIGSLEPIRAKPSQLKGALLEALQGVDRMVLTPPELPDDPDMDPETPLFEIKGREKILSLVALMDFEPRLLPRCECDGLNRFYFFRGRDYRFHLVFGHFKLLYSAVRVPWFSNAVLTPKSRDAVIAWFAREGYGLYDKLWKEDLARIAREQREHESVTSLFPPDTRAWFPRMGSQTFRDYEGHCGELAARYRDKGELILTCWRAMGRTTNWRYAQSACYGEPFGFLRGVLRTVSPQDIQAALQQLSPEDKYAWLGASLHLLSPGSAQGELMAGMEPAWPVRLARYWFANGPDWARSELLETVAAIDTPEVKGFLLEIGYQGKAAESHGFHVPATEPQAIVSISKPESRGRAFINDCSSLLASTTNRHERSAVLRWRAQAYLESGDYESAYEDFRKAGGQYSHERLVASLAVGHYEQVYSHSWEAGKGQSPGQREQTNQVERSAFYLMEWLHSSYEEDRFQKDGISQLSIEQKILVLLARRQGWQSDFRRSPPAFCLPPDSGGGTLGKAVLEHILGGCSERELLAAMKTPREVFLGNWTLAELALLDGWTDKARRHLRVCLAAKTYTDPLYVIAHRRMVELDAGSPSAR